MKENKKIYDDLEAQIKELAIKFGKSEDEVRKELLELIESKIDSKIN